MVLSKLIYNAFKFIIQPAHKLDIGISEHIFSFSCFSHRNKSIIYGSCHTLPLELIRPWQPFFQTTIDKLHIHLEILSHYFIIK